MNWRDDAACLQANRDLFFPVGSGGAVSVQVRQAKAVCRQCPVQARCLEWALATDVAYGVWGGLDESERRQITRKAARRIKEMRRAAAPVG